ncbi:MAG: hypothetical protein QUS14_05925 [Pyrinomonadaceae bacterium]|nr:hypothetical protein [Pyrinomonadaceae bacterium]
MRNVKNFFAAATMMVVLVFGTTFAHGGIIVAGFGEKTRTTTTKTEVCTEPQGKVDWGIIVAGMGIIVAGFGIIVAGATEAPTECGIIVAG